MIIAIIIFWLCLAAVFHSYVLFPVIIRILASGKKADWENGNKAEQQFVSILISAFNEEDVIEDKIKSIVASDYPPEKFEILIGSDCSSDSTNEILERLAANKDMRTSFFFL